MREWVYTRVGESGRQLMAAEEGKITIDKAARGNLLALAEEDPAEVPPVVAEVIKCADDIWSSSVAKFKRMSTLSDVEDQRVRGSLFLQAARQPVARLLTGSKFIIPPEIALQTPKVCAAQCVGV